MIWYFTAHTNNCVCHSIDSQCLEYLGYITLVSFWNSWSHTDISCCYLLFLGDIWSSQFYASRPRRDFCPFWEVLASRPEKWSAEQNRAEGLKSECLQICSLSWLYLLGALRTLSVRYCDLGTVCWIEVKVAVLCSRQCMP